jgi:hypothetical protein
VAVALVSFLLQWAATRFARFSDGLQGLVMRSANRNRALAVRYPSTTRADGSAPKPAYFRGDFRGLPGMKYCRDLSLKTRSGRLAQAPPVAGPNATLRKCYCVSRKIRYIPPVVCAEGNATFA